MQHSVKYIDSLSLDEKLVIVEKSEGHHDDKIDTMANKIKRRDWRKLHRKKEIEGDTNGWAKQLFRTITLFSIIV